MAEIEGMAPSSTMSAGFDSRDLDEMRRIGHEVSFGPGEAIFEAGDRADAMFVVLEGEGQVDVGGRFHRPCDCGPVRPDAPLIMLPTRVEDGVLTYVYDEIKSEDPQHTPDVVERGKEGAIEQPGCERSFGPTTLKRKASVMSFIKTKDGTEIYYKDWGEGPAVTFSHGWPLSSDAWDAQMLFLSEHGFRAVAHDRRGFGRSSQASSGTDMNGYADDLAAVIETLDLRDVTLVGHSTGGAEVARYVGRHGTSRVTKVVLISAAVPALLQTDANPEGLPKEAFDGILAGLMADRSQFYKDLAIQFYGANRSGAKVSQGVLDAFWAWSMQSGLKNSRDSVMSLLTDFTPDLKRFDVPTLILHGEDDQIVPVQISAMRSAGIIKDARDIIYPGAPHGITATHQDEINSELLRFLES